MTTTKDPSKRRTLRASMEARGTLVKSGAPKDCGLQSADCGLGGTRSHEVTEVWGFEEEAWELDEVTVEPMPEGLHADGVRYGPLGFVALEVVGVPVWRKPAIDDELSWLWAREARLEALRSELAASRQWGLWELVCKRLDRVYAQSNERWRRWREAAGAVANGVCKSLVVVGSSIGDVADGGCVEGVVCGVCGGGLVDRDGYDADGFEISGLWCEGCVEMFDERGEAW